MKRLLLYFILISIVCNGQQKIKRHDLIGQWYAENKDSAFFNKDTILLVKYTNREERDDIKVKERMFLEPHPSVLVELTLMKKDEIDFGQQIFEMGIMRVSRTTKWSFKENQLLLTFLDNPVRSMKFEVIDMQQFSFERMIANFPTKQYKAYTTPALLLKRIPSK